MSPHGSMNKDFQIRFTAGFLFLLTVAACVFAWINFQKEHEFQIPYDGAWWVERGGHLVADRVEPDGPADKAGIRQGDELVTVNGREVKNTPGLERQLYAIGGVVEGELRCRPALGAGGLGCHAGPGGHGR